MRMDEQRVASIIEMDLMVLDNPELAELIGFKDGDLESRPQAVEKLWGYLKEKNIQNPKDMLKFTPDKTLEAIFEAKTNQECSMVLGTRKINSWNFGGTG